MLGTMELLGSTEKRTDKDKNGENMPRLEITEVILAHCNVLNNDYQQDLRALYTFVPNRSFGKLLDISSKNCISLKLLYLLSHPAGFKNLVYICSK